MRILAKRKIEENAAHQTTIALTSSKVSEINEESEVIECVDVEDDEEEISDRDKLTENTPETRVEVSQYYPIHNVLRIANELIFLIFIDLQRVSSSKKGKRRS